MHFKFIMLKNVKFNLGVIILFTIFVLCNISATHTVEYSIVESPIVCSFAAEATKTKSVEPVATGTDSVEPILTGSESDDVNSVDSSSRQVESAAKTLPVLPEFEKYNATNNRNSHTPSLKISLYFLLPLPILILLIYVELRRAI